MEFGKNITEGTCLSHHIISRVYNISINLFLMWNLDHVAKEISVRILLSKATLLPPIFPDHKFWSEVTSCTLNYGIKLMLHLLNWEYLYKFLEICIEDLSVLMCVCMYSLIQSFIYTSGDSWQCIFCFGL